MSKLGNILLLVAGLAASAAWSARAGLIAHYDFTDGLLTDNEVGASYTLNEVREGTPQIVVDPAGFAVFPGVDTVGSRTYLETPAFGTLGVGQFTVSFWWRTPDLVQGDFQGIFSNDDGGSTIPFSWQIDDNGDNLRVVSQSGVSISYPESNLSANTWYHTVLRKGGSLATTEFYVTPEGAGSVTLAGSQNTNPGGLNTFRLGINRADDSLFAMDLANVKIYNDASVNLNDLLAEGPGLVIVPEPHAAGLLALGLMILLRFRRNPNR